MLYISLQIGAVLNGPSHQIRFSKQAKKFTKIVVRYNLDSFRLKT
jgi:hypothetical protein